METNSIDMATKLRKEQLVSILSSIYPIGKIYITTVSTNPNTLFGFGTWSAFGAGRVLVCIDSGDTDFDTLAETRGAKTHTLSEAEMAAHHHTMNPPSTATGNNSATHVHPYTYRSTTVSTNGGSSPNWKQGPNAQTSGNASVDHTHLINIAQFNSGTAGSGTAHNNLQPYIVVYMFKRTA